MSTACRLSVVAALSFLAAPAAATPPDGAEAAYPRVRGGVSTDAGYASFGALHGDRMPGGPAALLSFRAGWRYNHLFSVYGQGSVLVLWHQAVSGYDGKLWTLNSGGLQGAALAAFTFFDRLELALGPAFDLVYLNDRDPFEDKFGYASFAGGGHARVSVVLYRMTHGRQRSMGLILGADAHLVVSVPGNPLWSSSGGLGWEWY